MIHGLDLADTERPPLAQLMAGGSSIHAGQTHRVWRGLVQVAGSTEPCVPVAFKWMSSQPKLAIELACSLAASEFGVRVPPGVLVLANREQLPGLPNASKPLPGTRDQFLCFGSLHQWPDDSTTRVLDDDAAKEFIWRRLCETPDAARAATWDELAANADRHEHNLIFDGQAHWFIDHELALAPITRAMQAWTNAPARLRVIEHRARANVIAEEMSRRRPANHGMLEEPPRFVRATQRLEALAERVRQWRTGHSQVDAVWPMVEVVLRGIALRLPALALMMNERLDVRSADSLWTSSSTPR